MSCSLGFFQNQIEPIDSHILNCIWQIFQKILCFSQDDFQPSATNKFIMDLTLSHFVFGRPNLDGFLREHASLGAHTDIIEFQAGKTTTFRWTHPGSRPLGFPINKQCPNCNRLKTRVPKQNDNGTSILVRCSACKHTVTYVLPAGWNWTHGPPVKGDQGQGA